MGVVLVLSVVSVLVIVPGGSAHACPASYESGNEPDATGITFKSLFLGAL